MDDLLRHTHASLLGFCSELATELKTKFGEDFTVFNLDGLASENNLGNGHIIGLEDFSYTERDDPVAQTAAMITISTYNDTNAMLRIKALSHIVDKTKALKEAKLMNEDTGDTIGTIKFIGFPQVPPKEPGESRIFQSVIVNAGIMPFTS